MSPIARPYRCHTRFHPLVFGSRVRRLRAIAPEPSLAAMRILQLEGFELYSAGLGMEGAAVAERFGLVFKSKFDHPVPRTLCVI